jgi:ribosomal protein S12 methylthiotransferase
MPKVSLISLGCAKNLVDSEVMLADLAKAGYELTDNVSSAEILIINTCGFIQSAREEALKIIHQALSWKKDRPGRRIVVTGCYVERFEDFLKVKYPQVDIWSGVRDFDRINEVMEGKKYFFRAETFLLDHGTPRVISTGPNWAYVKVSEGCSHRCSFCSIPLIKGPYRSRSISSIVQEVQAMSSLGVREVNLISHDTTYFGQDRKIKKGLVKLLEKLLLIKDIKWIRLLYGYPEEIRDDLLELLNEGKMCRYLDLPFQHASEKVLKKMGRSMDGKRALKLIEKIRRRVPGVVIRTSLIVGFPDEGRKEFKQLKDFVRQAEFEHLGVFAYSRESGTRAECLGDPVSSAEKEDRKREIMLIQKKISRKFYRRFPGQTLEVLTQGVNNRRSYSLVARAKFQAPEVDGLVLVEDQTEYFKRKIPDFIKVKITGSLTYDLVGKVADDQTG